MSALAVGGAVFGIATAVQASIPDASGVIHGCYNTSLAHGSPTGALRVIDTTKANGSCASWEAPLNWNANGVTGATGPTGPAGPTGPTGPSSLVTNYGAETITAVDTDVATVTLSTGAYSLSGTIYAMGMAAVDSVDCSLTESGGTATLHKASKGASASLEFPSNTEMIPILGDITVSSGPTTVHIHCHPQSGVDVQGTLFATAVGSITAQ